MKIVLGLLILIVGGVCRAESALPTLDQFKAELPAYDYACDVEKYFTGNNLVYLLGIDRIPTNQEFNQQLATIIPELFYESLEKLFVLNPELASGVYVNMKHEPMRFVCSHFITRHDAGAVAYARRHFFFAGEKTINLGAFVAALVTNSTPDKMFFNRAIFHEALHQMILSHKIFGHNDHAVDQGGQSDVVYSCSNYAWRPQTPSLDEILVINLFSAKRQLAPYRPTSPVIDKYIETISSERQLAKIEKEHKKHPARILLHAFSFNQCMACALARVKNNKVISSADVSDIQNANETCSAIAPKMTIRLNQSSTELEEFAPLEFESSDWLRQFGP